MKNFEFKNPTKILFGKDQIKKISKEIPKETRKYYCCMEVGASRKMVFMSK